jgi:hypothetical protein
MKKIIIMNLKEKMNLYPLLQNHIINLYLKFEYIDKDNLRQFVTTAGQKYYDTSYNLMDQNYYYIEDIIKKNKEKEIKENNDDKDKENNENVEEDENKKK